MAQTFATNATEALVGVDDGAGAGADAVTDAGPADAGTDAVEEAGLKGSHKLSWQQASSQLVRSPVIFTKVHAAKKNQKCIRMKMSCAMQRQQTTTKQSKYHCMSKSSDVRTCELIHQKREQENDVRLCSFDLPPPPAPLAPLLLISSLSVMSSKRGCKYYRIHMQMALPGASDVIQHGGLIFSVHVAQ